MDSATERQEPGSSQFKLAAGLAVAAAFIRLIPHPWNFTPVGALGLFGGARLRLWQALTLPLTLMVATDLALLVFWDWPGFNPYVYGSFMVSVALGRLLTRTNAPGRILLCTVAASVQFFLVTNFGVWAAFRVDANTLPAGAAYKMVQDDIYPNPTIYYANDPRGLAACYWLAAAFSRPEAPPLGFFGNLLAGDLFFTGLLFGAYAWIGAGSSGPLLCRPFVEVVMKFAAIIEYSQDKATIQEHRPVRRQYLASLKERGQLAASGPFTDDSGALIIYETGSRDEAEKLLQGDPFHQNGIFLRFQLRPWNPVIANRELFPGP